MGTVLFFGPFNSELQECFQTLEGRGAEVFWEKHERGFRDFLVRHNPVIVIAEGRDEGNDCRKLTKTVGLHAPNTPVVLLTEKGECPYAYRLGPRLESVCPGHHTTPEKLLLTVEQLLAGEAPLRSDLVPADVIPGLFGRTSSSAMKEVEAMVRKMADTDATVLIRGESGSGKGVIASSIHVLSQRRDKPFIKINCAALPSELLESELFGFERGAFTGAQQTKPGKFECANGGTILLDEMGELPFSMQAKLLHVLEDNTFARLGASRDIRVDARLLVSTNRDLEAAVQAGKFRKDLYYRLKVITVNVPPLRDRVEEIPLLTEYFIEKFSRQYERPPVQLSPSMLKIMQSYAWPGNIRELENLLKRVVILQDEKFLERELHVVEPSQPGRNFHAHYPGGLKEISRRASREAERDIILRTLQHTRWNRTLAAQILQVSYKTLLNKMQELGLTGPTPDDPKPEDFN